MYFILQITHVLKGGGLQNRISVVENISLTKLFLRFSLYMDIELAVVWMIRNEQMLVGLLQRLF